MFKIIRQMLSGPAAHKKLQEIHDALGKPTRKGLTTHESTMIAIALKTGTVGRPHEGWSKPKIRQHEVDIVRESLRLAYQKTNEGNEQ